MFYFLTVVCTLPSTDGLQTTNFRKDAVRYLGHGHTSAKQQNIKKK